MQSLILFSLLVPAAPVYQIKGQVELPNGKAAAQAVVFLRGSERSRPMKRAVVDQQDRRFLPHVSVVTVGTTVQFPNNDTVFHNVFAEFQSAKFDLGMYPRGTKKVHRFDRPGLAVLMCTIHPDMSAYVMVVDTPYYAVCDRNGRFTIPDVPAGSYQAQGWHESGAKDQTSFSISSGSPLRLKLKK